MPTAQLSDARIHYELTGTGEPLVLVPGLGSTCRAFDPVVPALAERFTVIAHDTRGIGLSTARRPPATLADYAADLVELIDHLQLDRVHLMGASLGGMIAQRFAMDHAPRLDRLVLVSTANRFSPYLREMAMMIGRALRHFPRAQYARLLELLSNGPICVDADPHRIDRRVSDFLHRNIPRGAIVQQLRALAASDPHPDDFLIAARTLVVAGEYDALIPHCYGRKLAAEIGPNARFLLVGDAGHNPLAECPATITPRIVRFLSGQESDEERGDDREAA